jgi:DNA-binding response OmpR family regulator
MSHVLVIEDDPLILEPVLHALKGAGYEVSKATDGAQGLALALEIQPDLVILDLLLPEMDGWEVCKALRSRSTVPILILTALNEEIDRILGLELGADDYFPKPFSTRELIARIKALLRRVELDSSKFSNMNSIQVKDVSLNLNTRRVYKHNIELQLRYKEFELLSLLMTNAGEVVTRAEIFDKVWGTDWLGDMRTLDVHIRWLREKLEDNSSDPHYIQTVRSIGYRFVPG